MDIVKRNIGPRRRWRYGGKIEANADKKYQHNIQMYTEPPLDNVSLQEFEEMAVERLQVLRAVERVILLGTAKKPEEKEKALRSQLRNLDLVNYVALMKHEVDGDEEQQMNLRKRDNISHWILRLAFCRSEELRKWMIQQEVELFKCRFYSLTSSKIDDFLTVNNLKYTPISEEEKEALKSKLNAASGHPEGSEEYQRISYYKVSFTEALDLVRSRRVYLQDGFVYVPNQDLLSLIVTIFRARLSKALVVTCRALPALESDDRLTKILKDFDKRYAGENYCNKNAQKGITPEMIGPLSKTSFPLCMRELHESLTSSHHLRHGGRMQYGLFLKGIGVSLEDALKFWRSEFTKVIESDKFDKQYSYNIRHNYGKEGNRRNYTPYSCVKIIQGSVGPGESHGCPFRHYDPAQLKAKLNSFKVNQQGIEDIMDLVKEGKYQIACTRYFSCTHGSDDVMIQHPNQYYEESRKILSGEKSDRQGGLNKVSTTKSVYYGSSQTNSNTQRSLDSQSSEAKDDWDDEIDPEMLEIISKY